MYVASGAGSSAGGVGQGGADRRVSLSMEEPVLIQAELRLDCTQEVRLLGIEFESSGDNVCRVSHTEVQLDHGDDGLCGVLRQKDDCFCCCLQLTPLRCGRLSFGVLVVRWQR